MTNIYSYRGRILPTALEQEIPLFVQELEEYQPNPARFLIIMCILGSSQAYMGGGGTNVLFVKVFKEKQPSPHTQADFLLFVKKCAPSKGSSCVLCNKPACSKINNHSSLCTGGNPPDPPFCWGVRACYWGNPRPQGSPGLASVSDAGLANNCCLTGKEQVFPVSECW